MLRSETAAYPERMAVALAGLTAGRVESATQVTLRRRRRATRADVVPPERLYP